MYGSRWPVSHHHCAATCIRIETAFAALLAIASIAEAQPNAASSGSRAVTRYGTVATASPVAEQVPFGLQPTPPANYVNSPLTFNFNVVGNLFEMQHGSPAQQALAQKVINGFVEAADHWRAHFVDPITVDIDIDFGPIGNGVLGGALPELFGISYHDSRSQMVADATSADDASAIANLQPGNSLQFITNNTSFDNSPNRSPRIRDNDVGYDSGNSAAGNNEYLAINSANAKALGFQVQIESDANITFTDFSDFMDPVPTDLVWDFDRSDGISPRGIDFVGVAIHEIGHAMGFVSGVDAVDIFGSPYGPLDPLDLGEYAVFGPLDLYRYSQNSLTQPSQPAGGLLDLAFGSSAPNDVPFFSINGGATRLGTFSTGAFNGDGNQASHWQEAMGHGIMNPTISTGVLSSLSALDIRAIDVIGWDLRVPEPGSAALCVMAMVGLYALRPIGRMRPAQF